MVDVHGLDGGAVRWRQAAATLAAEMLASHAAEVDAQARLPKEGMAALAHGGFYGLCLGTQFGGHGQGPSTFAAGVEELARQCASTAMVYVALVQGHIDIAWNSPLAWFDAERQLGGACRAIAMRDTDRDRVSHIITKMRGSIATVEDLRGKTLAVGAKDSPQATLIPLGWLQRQGLEPGRDFQVRRFDVLVGKHGDHVGGELQAFQCLDRGEADASAVLDLNWERWTRDGTIGPHAYRILTTTAPFDHCCFTVRADFSREREQEFLRVLFAMRYDDPKHREMMDLEGLKAWVPGRTTGYTLLQELWPPSTCSTSAPSDRPSPNETTVWCLSL